MPWASRLAAGNTFFLTFIHIRNLCSNRNIPMKYFIDSKRPIDEAIDIEREMPLRSNVAKAITKRYRCDVHYFYADRVGMIFIVDLDDAEQLSEIVLLLRRAGLIPQAYPLVGNIAVDQILLDIAEIM